MDTTKETMNIFRPCPFCYSTNIDYGFEFGDPEIDGYWVAGQVCCKDCGARGSRIQDNEDAQRVIIQAWNADWVAPVTCKHGKGLTDYCEPCGRVNGG